jgi:ATP-dependent Lon protease
MEIIELHIYTKNEKLQIAKNHLVSKQLKRHGLTRRTVKITDEAIIELIDHYTREAGVRNLEREIANLCRKAAKYLIETNESKIVFNSDNVVKFLGGRKYLPEIVEKNDEIGVANGLAYTEVGGDMLKIEVSVLEGEGKLELTGSLGDVMKESARAALTYVRSIASEYGIDSNFHKTRDIHIHVPDGAVPKDGPSAGITMMSAIISALSGRPLKHTVAMTGEITIRGRVLPIGGLREKTMAAYTAGIKEVIIPYDNVKDLENLDKLVLENIKFIPCKNAKEVLAAALMPSAVIYTDIHTANIEENMLSNIMYAREQGKSKGESYGI